MIIDISDTNLSQAIMSLKYEKIHVSSMLDSYNDKELIKGTKRRIRDIEDAIKSLESAFNN